MIFEQIEGVNQLTLDLVATTTLAALLLVFGIFVRKKIPFFERFCFPAPVIGGFLFSVFAWILKETNLLTFKLDVTLQTPSMIVFFTTVGLGGSVVLIKKGGKALFIYLVACWGLAISQNVIGVVFAMLTGIDPVLGVMAGAVSLEGGLGAAAAFGPTAEELGVSGATAVAIASATFGLIIGGLIGEPFARVLIEKHKLPIDTDSYENSIEVVQDPDKSIDSNEILSTMAIIGVIMVLGALLSGFIKSFAIQSFSLPAYVGAMFVAVLFRNLNDSMKLFKMKDKNIDLIADISLGLFLTMAMMSLKIWELASLALPLIIILVVQVIFILVYSYFIVFRVLGKSYDSAVLCAGMLGHGLGATPNAVANMKAVCEHYGVTSTKAFLIVPLCGAVLIDLVGIPSIILFINFFSTK